MLAISRLHLGHISISVVPPRSQVLPTLIACRLAMSLTIGTYSASQEPDNAYLRLTLQPGWRALQLLRAADDWFRTLLE